MAKIICVQQLSLFTSNEVVLNKKVERKVVYNTKHILSEEVALSLIFAGSMVADFTDTLNYKNHYKSKRSGVPYHTEKKSFKRYKKRQLTHC